MSKPFFGDDSVVPYSPSLGQSRIAMERAPRGGLALSFWPIACAKMETVLVTATLHERPLDQYASGKHRSHGSRKGRRIAALAA
jgi:hypothetical protein